MVMLQKFQLTSKIMAIPDVLSTRFGTEAVLLNLNGGAAKYLGLEGIGGEIWHLIEKREKPVAVADIRNAILQSFDVDADQCEKDLFEFLGRLQETGLIRVLES